MHQAPVLGNRSIELLILFVGQAMAHRLELGNKSCSFLGRPRGVEFGKQSIEQLKPFLGQARRTCSSSATSRATRA
jgi:hypothetical protein